MASTNFRVFNEANAPANTYNDSEYQNATQRQSGVTPGMAISRMHNKMYYQWSTMATAIAQYLVSRGYDCNDNDIAGIVSALENSCGLNIRQDSTEYEAGDIAYSAALSSVLFLQCTTAGTTASSIPATITGAAEGDSITDGTVVWIVRKIASMADVRAASPGQRQASTAYAVDDMASLGSLPYGWYLACTTAGTTSASPLVISTPAVGDTVTDGTVTWTIRKISSSDGVPLGAIIAYSANGELPSGYLLCDGSAVSRTMFPDLFAAIGTTYGAGDGSTTFNLPDYSDGKFPEGSTVAGTVKQPGLPNIEGKFELGDRDVGGTAYGGLAVRTSDGAFDKEETTNYCVDVNGYTGWKSDFVTFDASKSNPIYGASNTVQPYSLTTRYIIKAYDGVTPTPSQADISEMLTELTGKANINGSNMTYHKDVITTSGTYTAPATGLYKITVKGGGGGGGGGYHSSDSNASGGGGGEGGTTITYVKMLIGDSATVAIGAGGAGGAVNAAGTNGGDSVVTVDSITYTGGGGGAGNVQISGAGGAGTINGNPGGIGLHSPSGLGVTGGAGGGAGGAYGRYASTGLAGVSGAGGAGGAGESNGGYAGGAGGDGYVFFEYYTPGA